MTGKLNRDTARRVFPAMSKADLMWMGRQIRLELQERYEETARHRERVAAAMAGMANVMAGVTWALACRQSLRRSKDHWPDWGIRPASGEMWLPWEILTALRAEIKGRRWSPLGMRDAGSVLNWLTIERDRKPEPEGDFAVQFRVRMAGETARVA